MAALTPTARAVLTDIPYTGAPLDRADPLRRDPEALARLRADPRSHLLLIWRNRVLVTGVEAPAPGPRILTVPATWTAPTPALAVEEEVFLGLDGDGVAWFAGQIPAGAGDTHDPVAVDPGRETGPDLGLGGLFLPLRAVGPNLPAGQAAMQAQALGVLAWHRRHRFCAACGAPSHPVDGGWRRRCGDPSCDASHFPRTDPAVIMLVTSGSGDDARCLLAHADRMPPGQISTLAGFVEPGESLEEAVRREVWEETAIRVGTVAYAASQPWPFPASMMIGFHGRAETTDIVIDPRELEYAAWYDRAQVRHLVDAGRATRGGPPGTDGLMLPRGDSIARRLILGWLAGDPLDGA
ncbi:NAD(+) diphosphatase [Roseospira visakhapatnamensis]|uniref:NAD(+) diphosphatase n=1 Tax=Roseospira visakhapatnamensis TaxID=390880 RepID=A0A7W6RCT9_9PROT|nr:NAD(+) diphosphatase [Roseospira visakhapatnamensis]MBB4265543.1 NAD+ diphosphatase [Roseospira visakhapatnamensis]